MNFQRRISAVEHQNALAVRRHLGKNRLMPGVRAPDDGGRLAVDDEQRVAPGGRGVNPIAVGGEVEGVGERSHRDPRGDLVDVRVELPNVAAQRTDSPDFGAGGVFAQAGKSRSDEYVRGWGEFYQVDDGEATVGVANVSV